MNSNAKSMAFLAAMMAAMIQTSARGQAVPSTSWGWGDGDDGSLPQEDDSTPKKDAEEEDSPDKYWFYYYNENNPDPEPDDASWSCSKNHDLLTGFILQTQIITSRRAGLLTFIPGAGLSLELCLTRIKSLEGTPFRAGIDFMFNVGGDNFSEITRDIHFAFRFQIPLTKWMDAGVYIKKGFVYNKEGADTNENSILGLLAEFRISGYKPENLENAGFFLTTRVGLGSTYDLKLDEVKFNVENLFGLGYRFTQF